MVHIIKDSNRFKGTSHQTVEQIKEQQARHRKDLLQPRVGGELNMEFLKEYGAKNIRLTIVDIAQMDKKNKKWADALRVIYKAQQQEKWQL